jgi:cytochrome bd-type quinol oxidase subunit 2
VIVEILVLALASTVRPTSVAAVYALLAQDGPRRLMVAYVATGLAFTLAFGAIVVVATQGIHIQSGETNAIADIAGGVLALAFGLGVLTGLVRSGHTGDAPAAQGRLKAALARRITFRTTLVAGPATHIPGLFYVIALNLIIAHNADTAGKVLGLLTYNAIWFALPLLALATCMPHAGLEPATPSLRTSRLKPCSVDWP